MEKSLAQKADEILGGALTDTSKNPYDGTTGHQAGLPAMDADDTLVEMSDSQRATLMGLAGIAPEESVVGSDSAPVVAKPLTENKETTTLQLTPQDLETLAEAKRIIEKIQEATTVGSIGVNMAGVNPLYPAKAVKPKKRTKKKVKTEASTADFLAYLKA